MLNRVLIKELIWNRHVTSGGEWIKLLPERLERGLKHLRDAVNIFKKLPKHSALNVRNAGEALLKHIVYRDSKEIKKNLTLKSLREKARQQNLITEEINMNLEIIAKVCNYNMHDNDDADDSTDEVIKLALTLMEKCYIWHLENEGILPNHKENFNNYIRPEDAIQKAMEIAAEIVEEIGREFDEDMAKVDEEIQKVEKIRKGWKKAFEYQSAYPFSHKQPREFGTTKGLKAELMSFLVTLENEDTKNRVFSGLRKRARKHYINELWTPKIGDLVRFKDKNEDFKGELIRIKNISQSNGRKLWMGLVSNRKNNHSEWFSLFDLIKITPDDFKDYNLDDF